MRKLTVFVLSLSLVWPACRPSLTATTGNATPSCSDEKRNGDESDVDCGGSCAACANDRNCTGPSDCQSGICRASDRGVVCIATSCTDQLKNKASDFSLSTNNTGGLAAGVPSATLGTSATEIQALHAAP